MKMTPEGKLQSGKFGSESGRMIGGASMERTGSRSAELLLAGDGPVIVVQLFIGDIVECFLSPSVLSTMLFNPSPLVP